MLKKHRTKLFLAYLGLYFIILLYNVYQQESFVLDEGAHAINSLFFEKYFSHFTLNVKNFIYKFYSFYSALFLNEYPPLLAAPLGVLYLFTGADIFVSRILISIFSIATLYLVYVIGEKVYNENVGIYSAVFLSTIPYFLEFSSLLMMEVPVLLFLLLCTYFLYKRKPIILVTLL